MDVMNLHHLAVPCIAKENPVDISLYTGDEIFYLNPRAVIRYEPLGAVITPPILYASYLHIDSEVIKLLRRRAFSGLNLPNYVLSLLIENDIISRKPFTTDDYREIQVEVSGLPTQVLFEVTSYCNCDCIACYHKDDLNGHIPSLKQLIMRIDKLRELGLSMFEVTGGEPFSRPDLHQVLDHIDRLGLHFYVVSNGEYLADCSPKLIDVLKKGLGIAVSLDGFGQIHDRIRQRPGLYDKMIAGMDILHAQGIKIYLISTLSEASLSCVTEMINVAKRYETTIHFRPVIRTGAAIINNLQPINLVQALGGLLQHLNVRNGLLSTKKSFPRSRYYGCGLRKRISVNSLGSLYPCVMDRSYYGDDIHSYSASSLVARLEEDTRRFLVANAACHNCHHNNKDLRCGGFCHFSRSYQKERV